MSTPLFNNPPLAELLIKGTIMEMNLTTPTHITSLHSSCYVVSVEVSTWGGTKQDRSVSNEVTVMKKASAEAGKFTKMLMAGDSTHKTLVNYRQTVYNWVQRCTYDWAGKSRLLPMMELPKFEREFKQHLAQFEALKAKFAAEYNGIVANMAFEQGDLFNRTDYPDLQTILNKFSMRLMVTDVPKGDFRNAVSQELAEDLHNHYQKQAESIMKAAMDKAAKRLITLAERVAHSCAEPKEEIDEDGTVKKTRRPKIVDSTFEQAREMCAILRDFNLTNDPEIEEARAKLESALHGVTTEDLRERATTRKAVKDEVDDLIGKFGAFKRIGRDEEDDEE